MALNDHHSRQCLHGDGKWYSYREVRDNVSQVITELESRGVDGPVALLANNSVEMVFALSAVVATGTNHVPLNSRGSARDHAEAIRHVAASILIYDAVWPAFVSALV
nr:AMP-binding protein [Rhodococcus wratislaviensis]GLK40796.1 hypothetical protein GCM10017611_76710 [Rhodococcus wratislaviensis]